MGRESRVHKARIAIIKQDEVGKVDRKVFHCTAHDLREIVKQEERMLALGLILPRGIFIP